ncbi:MAG: cytochrome c, partial [Bacteroidetes bacterium]|nr:cytochrome c [Bacteroidota bacterium]
YKGDKKKFGAAQLTAMERRKDLQPHIKTPDIIKDNVNIAKLAAGAKLYNTYCGSCHQSNGKGDGTRFPPLENSEYVKGDRRRLISIVLNGLSGPITVNGVGFNEVMPPNSYLNDDDIALILTYVRANFKNNTTGIQPQEVARIRALPKTPQ